MFVTWYWPVVHVDFLDQVCDSNILKKLVELLEDQVRNLAAKGTITVIMYSHYYPLVI
jgi:hypothetical protein